MMNRRGPTPPKYIGLPEFDVIRNRECLRLEGLNIEEKVNIVGWLAEKRMWDRFGRKATALTSENRLIAEGILRTVVSQTGEADCFTAVVTLDPEARDFTIHLSYKGKTKWVIQLNAVCAEKPVRLGG